MATKIIKFVILSTFLLAHQASFVQPFDINFGDIGEMLNFARETVMGSLEALEFVRQRTPQDHVNDFPFIKRMEVRLINQIQAVSRKIKDYETKMESRSDEIIATITRDIPLRHRLDRNMHEIARDIGRIDDIYINFNDYASDPAKFEDYTMVDFAKTCVSSGRGDLPDLLKDIHRLVVPITGSFDSSVLILLAQNTKVGAFFLEVDRGGSGIFV